MAKFIEVTPRKNPNAEHNGKCLINTRWVEEIHSKGDGACIYFAFTNPGCVEQDYMVVQESYEEVKMKVWGCNGE